MMISRVRRKREREEVFLLPFEVKVVNRAKTVIKKLFYFFLMMVRAV